MTTSGSRSYTVSLFEPADSYRSPAVRTAPPCHRCHGDGRVCNACERPGDECGCQDRALPTPKACPDCGGSDDPPPRADALLRFHWWCMKQATRHDRPGYPLLASLFDWVGGRAVVLYRWRVGR